MAISTVLHTNKDVFKVTLDDGTVQWVPLDPQNKDYVAVQKWEEEGGVIAVE